MTKNIQDPLTVAFLATGARLLRQMGRKYKIIICQYCQFRSSLISPPIKQIEQNIMETDKKLQDITELPSE